MQQYLLSRGIRLFNVIVLMLSTILVQAQDKIEIDKEDIGSWFQRNWIWVAGGVLLILLISLMGSRGKAGSRKTTTVIKDEQGHTKSVTTTEEKF